jgi:hypothetical protein
MPTKRPRPSKKTQIAATRREYNRLRRAYHAAGKKAMGKPKKSEARRDYQLIKREVNLVGRRLGKLTGAHKGR